jgi:hypothetical protein
VKVDLELGPPTIGRYGDPVCRVHRAWPYFLAGRGIFVHKVRRARVHRARNGVRFSVDYVCGNMAHAPGPDGDSRFVDMLSADMKLCSRCFGLGSEGRQDTGAEGGAR